MHIDEPTSGAAEQEIPGWRFAVASGILGWVLDAFNFFIVVFLFDQFMARFHVSKGAIVLSLTLTLAMRPVGALIFGSLADRYGRKKPLIACVIYFSVVTVLTAFAPTYFWFLVLRALYGIGMGGYWGIGASYTMESAPPRKRGFLSGMMQGGYPFGYLVASLAMLVITPRFGWQSMFLVGSIFALVIVILTMLAPESASWTQHEKPTLGGMLGLLWENRGGFLYLLLLMTMMSCLSHGTQDLYPDFLKSLPWMARATVLGMKASLGIPILYNVGAIVGALVFGHLSEKIGRRYAIMLALLVSLLSIPAWAFGGTVLALVLGSYFMQTGVQGAFGVIPAHLNELSPDAIRGLFPGFVYQLGVLVASPSLLLQNTMREHLGYPWALTYFELGVILSLMLIFFFGPENRGKSFVIDPDVARMSSE